MVYHSGAVPGLSTLVSFLPSDDIGVTLFANGESKAEPLMLILNRILDSALHLTGSPTRIPTRFAPFFLLRALGMTEVVCNSSPTHNVTRTDSDARNSALSLDLFAGAYTNPGYGSFTLCSPSSPSSYCTQVRSNFSIVDNVQGNPRAASSDLLAEWPRVCSSHVRLRHQTGSIFEIYFTSLYTHGYGKDTSPFETGEVGTPEGIAEFVVEDGRVVGFGVSGLVGQLTERARTYESVQDRAEVWFDRVG